MTEHRPELRVEVSAVVAPDGSRRVLLQADEWHVLLLPREALWVGVQIAEVVVAMERPGVVAEDGD